MYQSFDNPPSHPEEMRFVCGMVTKQGMTIWGPMQLDFTTIVRLIRQDVLNYPMTTFLIKDTARPNNIWAATVDHIESKPASTQSTQQDPEGA